MLFFFFFPQKIDFDIPCKGDNLHETSVCLLGKIKNISKCGLPNFLMLSIKHVQTVMAPIDLQCLLSIQGQ